MISHLLMKSIRIIFFLFLASLSVAFHAHAASRPNVLLILVDDLKPNLGCYGDTLAITPNIDALAASGMRFDLAYCNQAVCAPSRFTLMLGSHSTSTGLYGLGSHLRQLVPDAVTMPQFFAKQGYRTESLGKVFHIGHGNEGDPQSFSIPHFKDKVIEYLDPDSTDGGQLTREEALFTNQALDRIRSLPRGAAYEDPVAKDTDYADGRVAVETVHRLQAAAERRKKEGTPFFIAAGFVRPHLPFSAPKKYWDLHDPEKLPYPDNVHFPVGAPEVATKKGGEITAYKPVPPQGDIPMEIQKRLIHGYYASSSFVDAQIGQVLKALRDLDLEKDTIVVLWGDHGFHLGDLGIWTKHTNYEQANRIPILIRAPGVTRPGSSTRQLAESVDIFPTLAALAGLPAPKGPQPMDGVSLLPVLQNPSARVRDHAYHAYPKRTLGRAIRTERYRMVEWKEPGAESSTAEFELYDYQEDPNETRNLAGERPKVMAQLQAMLARHPEAVDRNGKKVTQTRVPTPEISRRSLTLQAEVRSTKPAGVVLAQGGREHGYALHFIDGIPTFDVRVQGKVTRLKASSPAHGKIRLFATLTPEVMTLQVNDNAVVSQPSPGLIPVQPKDGLSVGQDDLSAAGDYESPNPFNGKILSQQVTPSKETAKTAPKIFPYGDGPGRWPAEKARAWYDGIRWPVGANFSPSSAINQLEMWQEETFDPETIDRELGWARDMGMNTMRVYLHDLAWKQDPKGFFKRVDTYLELAEKHGIRTLFVIFDGVWYPYPKIGKQPEPRPGLHNSGWVQSPGREILEHPERYQELEPYVKGLLQRYGKDARVLAWDLFNEPDNAVDSSYGQRGTKEELSADAKRDRASDLLRVTLGWAREVNPDQPLTIGVWMGDYLNHPTDFHRLCIENSDVVSFHCYGPPEEMERLVEGLATLNRPLFCTEYMARGNRSTFEGILPILHRHRVGAWNWGFVSGKSQTIYPWDSWQKAYTSEPDPWFHDILRQDGTPYSKAEVRLIRSLAAQPPTQPSQPPKLPQPPTRKNLEAGLRSHDRALFVKSGWIRDPFITRGPDGMYYITGTTPLADDPREQSDPYNTGLGDLSLVGWHARVWRSPDLIEWTSLGSPFTLEDGIWPQANPEAFEKTPKSDWKLWAPELHWLGTRWALVHTSPSPVAGANLSLSNGPEVQGPWINPMGAAIRKRHDPSLFHNDDGTWWMVWGATEIAPLSKDFSNFTSKPIRIGPSGETSKMGHEGCLLHKIHGKYVLFGTGWSTAQMRRGSYNLYYATADRIEGPYSERKFVGRFLGHGTPFQDAQGRWWCTAFYNGNIPPLPTKGIQKRDLSLEAQTINPQGVTLVPLNVHLSGEGELVIHAKDPDYGTPGPDEAQSFPALARP